MTAPAQTAPGKTAPGKTAYVTAPVPAPAVAVPKVAMVLAAGLGERMRPVTLTTPKPLLEVGGKKLIDWSLDRLDEQRVERIVVNTHWLPDQIESHVAERDNVVISREATRLETGGGLVKALPLLGDVPFLVMNSDTVVLDGPTPFLQRMAAAWDDEKMDALLLVIAAPRTHAQVGYGDVTMDPLGRLTFREPARVAPYVCAGVYLYHPRLFAGAREEPFSVVQLWRRAAEVGRLYGLVHDGVWLTVGTPDELAAAEAALARGGARWLVVP
jgi:N-acetyl-alpha-D-muramate 1-phosphate uridylyltransferase